MSALQKLFKHTFIYGLATILPRVISLILTPLYTTKLPKEDYGIYSSLMIFLLLGNVVLSYGMETAFFRFVNKSERKETVQATALTSILVTSVLFAILGFIFLKPVAGLLDYNPLFVGYAIGILFFDALVVIPFAWFRNREMPIRYSVYKIGNVVVNLLLNLFFFLALPWLITEADHAVWLDSLLADNKVHYIFWANLMASFLTFLAVMPLYRRIGLGMDAYVLKKMLRYAYPVLIAGIAFSINEGFDRLFLRYLLPKETADAEVGVYAACYKLGTFMTLFVTAFKLGVEPFFFSHANRKNARETYAQITRYFIIFGSFIFLFVVVFTEWLAPLLIPDRTYWTALWVVPFILMANLCLGIYHNLSVWYKITDRTEAGAWISWLGAFITLGLNFALIPLLGYKGSAIATLAAYGTMMVCSYFWGRKHYPIPYDLRVILSYLGVSAVFAVLSFYVFHRAILPGSIMVLVFLGMIWYFERKELQEVLRPIWNKKGKKKNGGHG